MKTDLDARSLDVPTTDDRPVWDAWLSVYHLPTVTVADELGLFPKLAEHPLTLAETMDALELGPRATEALLGVLQSLGFVTQRGGRFHVTEVSRNYLLPDSPYYWGGMLQLMRDIPFTHSSLLDALRKDKPVAYDGQDIWERHEVDPEQARVFTAAMHSHSFPAAMGAARNGDFSKVSRLLDVGGGSACFPIALATRYPEMRFTIMELPVVCPLAEGYAADFGLSDRIDTLAADMFHDPWPSGYDAIFFSNIFHDWDRNRCEFLASRSFDALPSGGQIYLHEMLLNDTKDGPQAASLFSMNMCFFTEGKQFSAAELDDLLTGCGFTDVSITNTYGYYSLIRARKP